MMGVMMAGQAMAATIRYQESGDYSDTVAVTGHGWQAGGGGPGGLPGVADLGRLNWGNNTVTLTTTETIGRLQVGVDEQGNLVIANGGTLTTVAGSGQTGDVTIGQGNNPAGTGTMTVEGGGTLNVANILYHGNIANGTSEISGTVNVTSHLWTGWTLGAVGTININNGGVLNVSGQLGLNWRDNGAVGYVNVKDGGVLNLSQIHPTDSIRGSSVLDISGSGVVTIPGDLTAVMSAYTNALKIKAYGGLGTVGIDYNNMNEGKTTLFAIEGEVPLLETVWNPAANPNGTGKWNERTNWTGFVRPGSITKVTFNVVGAIPCTVTDAAVADYVVMGDNGPGGTLIITNGGSLTCGTVNAAAIGYNSNALMVVENGGSASFGYQLWIGLNPDSDGTLIMNGGTVSVAGSFGLGWQGGKGTVQINGGTLNLSQWDYFNSIQGESVLDVSGTGKVVLNGNQVDSVNSFISTGQITNRAGPDMLVVDYNNILVGKTTIYPMGVYLPPERITWDPVANPSGNGLWNESANWTGGVGPSNVTEVRFNVPDAIPCTVTNAAFAKVMRIGLGGPGGTLIITNGGSLACSSANDWNSIGMNNTGLLVVEDGGSASFGNHLWIGFEPTADGTLIMNGGTVSVGQMFGLGWNGGKGTALINGGTLNLSQLSPTDSIKGESVLNVAGTGKVVINGDQQASVVNYISAGKITANGGPNVFYSYDPGANQTTISAVLLPAPRQSITAISVSDGNVSITYQTAPQHTYYLESTPSLSPTSWTPVAGSTNPATGVPVTFIFPASPGQMFYRTVSP